MGFEIQMPCIDFTKHPEDLVEGSEGWKNLCKLVREGGEVYGGFQVVYDKIPVELHEKMFQGSKSLFDLPLETKQKSSDDSKSHNGYAGKFKFAPLYESLTLPNPHNLEEVQAFTDTMWPKGNQSFCETVNNTSKMMTELEQIIRKMIFQSYGADTNCDSLVKDSWNIFRFTQYKAPTGKEMEVGLPAHVDKNLLTILYQNEEGLQIETKEGEWLPAVVKDCTFTVFVGEAFKTWSNGKLHAVEHQVMMKGPQKDRYSYGLFSIPNESPKERDEDDLPLLFCRLDHHDYDLFTYTNNTSALCCNCGKMCMPSLCYH
ncbi:hypothetical protein C5167_034774 [Papaver somniferum]|uniref:Fe2OG dioxygenase domain-containing protein n=1 Tax=Papaver somniferum TaxID=3469 RepID=A0A4Y7KFG1_PAPSO|nr:probable 2-oxoglutarate-dependent dioxygenase AOP1 [Papaver somniferum]RZC71586.1 hypothetical protein C5167_034774 [Papaver somniferum]